MEHNLHWQELDWFQAKFYGSLGYLRLWVWSVESDLRLNRFTLWHLWLIDWKGNTNREINTTLIRKSSGSRFFPRSWKRFWVERNWKFCQQRCPECFHRCLFTALLVDGQGSASYNTVPIVQHSDTSKCKHGIQCAHATCSFWNDTYRLDLWWHDCEA